MYYGDFTQPPVHETWDVEWGGLHGFADEWQDRSQQEVQTAVEIRAGTTLPELAAAADRVRTRCQTLHREFVTVVSPICDAPGFEREAGLLAAIDEIKWIVPPASFVQALAPSQFMSRDSRAISQGLQAPLHLNVEAAIVSNTTTLSTSEKFLQDSVRLGRQARTKLDTESRRPVASPALRSSALDAGLAGRLRLVSWLLFIVLGSAIIALVTYLLRVLDPSSLPAAVLISAGALAVLGLYAALIDRSHAKRALFVLLAAAGGIAALDQLLAHLESSPPP
jgi:hypothetical protein